MWRRLCAWCVVKWTASIRRAAVKTCEVSGFAAYDAVIASPAGDFSHIFKLSCSLAQSALPRRTSVCWGHLVKSVSSGWLFRPFCSIFVQSCMSEVDCGFHLALLDQKNSLNHGFASAVMHCFE